MEGNYSAWDINIPDFYGLEHDRDKRLFLIRFAVLAPSSHNSQPWKFRVSDQTIEIRPESSRALPDSDADNRQLFISLGCAMANLLIAAEHYGYATETFIQEAGAASFIQITLQQQDDRHSRASQLELIYAISERVTSRDKFTETIIPDSLQRFLQTAKEQDLSIFLIDEQNVKEQIADCVMRATDQAMADKQFRTELSQYVKPNTTKDFLGMPAFGMGIPTPLSLIAPRIIKHFDVGKLSRKTEMNLLKSHTPFMGIIASEQDTPKAWIKTGAFYQQIALRAHANGLATHPLAAAIQIGDHYKNLQTILQTTARPQFFFRLGIAKSFPHHSPRIPAKDVIESV